MRKRNAKLVVVIVTGVVFAFLLFAFAGCVIVTNVLDANLKIPPDDLAMSFCSTSDTEAPEITLNGDSTTYVLVGGEYEELGASASDDCDNVELTMNGGVDTTVIGSYTIIYSATDSSGNVGEVRRTVNVVPEHRGTIYLTFDDGPGIYTTELLDILARYNVKATFFVTGVGDDALILREYNEGHAVGLHTFTHNYAYIYQNMNAFLDDLTRVQERVKRITGYTSYLMRFPGGSSNTVSARYDGGARIMSKLVAEVTRRGFTYYDWNISSGDAGETTSSNVVYANVVNRLGDGDYVVLQHDIKGFSVAAVERIIQYGLANGYDFAKLEATSFAAHHRVNN